MLANVGYISCDIRSNVERRNLNLRAFLLTFRIFTNVLFHGTLCKLGEVRVMWLIEREKERYCCPVKLDIQICDLSQECSTVDNRAISYYIFVKLHFSK